ncbi:RRP15-like protein [Drosophila virilis]|uniref:RRP15-like protein n=1 Tax=Drosophila virilis TaxID=7244 RepID=B4M0U7_DROVI|nr:RRP15-like protein [Drosophila virilis]EDW68406.1 uncharacterized protein Dvir_GJ22554 [Drosophila virilis]
MMTLSSNQKAPPAADTSSDSGEECEVSACNSEGNPAWARTIAKLLKQNPPENQKRTVLSRAKKLKPNNAQVNKAKKTYDFEIDGTEVEPKKGKDIKKEQPSELDAHLTSQQRKNVPLQLRVKPNAQDLERERNLRKVATRGTVQFYNAVRIQQKELQQQLEDAGPLDSRKDAVLNNIDKGKFLDVLMSGKRARSEAIDNRVKKEELESASDDEDSTGDEMPNDAGNKKKSEWNVLREDFMTNKKIKHWDEEEEEQDDDEKADSDAAESEED